MDWKNILERAAWTFVEGFLGALVLTDSGFTRTALIAAAMAGLSALKTFILELARRHTQSEASE